MNIFKELFSDIKKQMEGIFQDEEIWQATTLETPKDPLNGDISSNIAMIIASKEGKNPREIAHEFKEHLIKIPYIAHIEVAGPGFINFTIKAQKWHDCIRSILNDQDSFWKVDIGKNIKVNVEYVSANPTGPMHIGHSRGAVYGDALAKILSNCGYDVVKEYYVNDAGEQINVLSKSSHLRYMQALTGKESVIPEGLYPGAYLIETGKLLHEKYGDALKDFDDEQTQKIIRDFTVDHMLSKIKEDLNHLGIEFDKFTFETDIIGSNKIEDAIKILEKKNLVYNGCLPPPKGKIDENWEEKEQLLFKSTEFGDDQDRPVKRSNDKWTYFASDLAYAKDKIDRGFDHLIYILGADHSGYVKRIKAAISALSDKKVDSDIRTNKLVNFVKDGKYLKMSKRQGNFLSLSEVMSDIPKDIIRFIMLTRRLDMTLDFNFEKVKELSKENPVFYVQYAHVRTSSILSKAVDECPIGYENFSNNEFDLSLINSEEEIGLIKLLASWPKYLESAAVNHEPHRIAYYLIDVASRFHSIWNLGKENNNYRFNINDNPELTSARLALADSIKRVIAAGLDIIGVKALDKM